MLAPMFGCMSSALAACQMFRSDLAGGSGEERGRERSGQIRREPQRLRLGQTAQFVVGSFIIKG